MAATKLAVHIPTETEPTNITQLTTLLSEHSDLAFSTGKGLQEFAGTIGLSTRQEIRIIAAQLGLLVNTGDSIALSDTGQIFAGLKDNIKSDILHFFFYTGWDKSAPLEFLPAWSYRVLSDDYWGQQEVVLDGDYLESRVQEIINRTEQYFHNLGVSEFEGVSFSRKSLNGLHKWLESLNPSVIEDGRFTRRAFCPPELLLLAVGYVLGGQDDAVEADLLLSREKREAICRVCLLDPNAFDRTLDWMLPIFPAVISPGTTAGFYGRFVRLHKLPELVDIVR